MNMRALICRMAMAAGLTLLLAGQAPGERQNPNTDWFKDAGYGVFVHFLWDVQNIGGRANTLGKPPTSWDDLINGFDTEKFADLMKESGAGYVFFTMMQRTRYIIAPNETYERLTGYKRGEATATRDLVEDLHKSLNKRGIPLMLYWTGDGPRQDKKAADSMGGWNGTVTDDYVRNWADVAAEYSKRYGEKVRGWWVDGCYSHIAYNDKRWGILAAGLKAGNPKSIVALNNPSMRYANSSTDHEDFTTGEVNAFNDIPDERWRDGKQFHVLSYLGKDWGHPGCRYNLEYMGAYVSQVMAAGGVVTIDVCLYRDGLVDPAQIKLLSQLRPAVKKEMEALVNRAPIPVGNLACWKPARLLKLNGAGTLPPNGGGGTLRLARCGVDGKVETWAQAGGEYAWTYEVDLKEKAPVARVVVSFGKEYATQYEVALSPDGKEWKVAASKQNHDGSKAEHRFEAVDARYIRVRALKPDGPNQPGGQMQICELEAYAK